MLKAVRAGAMSWYNNQSAGRGIVMVQQPIPTLSLFWTLCWRLSSNCFNTFKWNCLSWRNHLPVPALAHHLKRERERAQPCLDSWVNLTCFFWSGWIQWSPLTWLLLWIRVVAIAPTLITSYNFCEKLRVIFELFLHIAANTHTHTTTCLFLCEQTRHKCCSNPFHLHIFR
jgi:hypothetical protein